MSDSSTPIRVGVVGCGRVAQGRHLPIVADMEETQLSAIADVSETTRSELAAKYEGLTTFSDYQSMLSEAELDAVMVAAPTAFHAAAVVAALEAGKHVMVEKPLALSLDEVDAMDAAAEKSGRLVAVAMNSRWHRLMRECRDQIKAGMIGPVGLVRSIFTDGFRHNEQPREWMMRHDQGGAVLVEQAVHHFDLWRFLLDSEVVEVYARMNDPQTLDERAVINAEMSNGTLVTGMFSEGLKDANEVEVYGRDGRLRVSVYDFDGLDLTPKSEYPGSMGRRIRLAKQFASAFPGAMKRKKLGGDWGISYRSEWHEFISAIREERVPQVGLAEGRAALSVGLAAMASLAKGRPVRVEEAPRGIARHPGLAAT